MSEPLRKLRSLLWGSQLRRNVTASSAANLVSAGATLINYPLALHFLGYKVYGLWLSLSFVNSVAQLSGLGLAPAVTKFVAEDQAKAAWQKVRQIWATANLLTLGVGLLVLAPALCAQGLVLEALGLRGDALSRAAPLFPGVALLSVYSISVQIELAVLAGLGRSDWVSGLSAGARLLALGLSALGLCLGWGLWALLFANLCSLLVQHGLSILLARRLLPKAKLALGSGFLPQSQRLLGMGLGVLGSSGLQILVLPANRVLLTWFAGLEAVPVFEVAWGAAMQLRSVLAAGLQVLVADISHADARGDSRRIEAILRHAHRALLRVAAPGFALVMLLAQPLLQVWLTSSYHPHILPAFRLMLVSAFFSMWGVPAYYQLLGMGRSRQLFMSQLVLAVGNLGLGGALAWSFGLSPAGLSAGLCLANLMMCSYLAWQSRRCLQELKLASAQGRSAL